MMAQVLQSSEGKTATTKLYATILQIHINDIGLL